VISPGVVKFPWFQQWNALVPEPAKTCQQYFENIGVPKACPSYQMALFASVADPSRLAVSKTEWVRAGQKSTDHQCCALVRSYGEAH
jgi:hypothetical protein